AASIFPARRRFAFVSSPRTTTSWTSRQASRERQRPEGARAPLRSLTLPARPRPRLLLLVRRYLGAIDDLLLDVARHLVVVAELHRVRPRASRHAVQRRLVAHHLRQGRLADDHRQVARQAVLVLDPRPLGAVEVAQERPGVLRRRR